MVSRLIIDTDPGVDDALALVLAVRSTRCEILAITTTCGNSTVENSTRNAKYIFTTIGIPDVPLYEGLAAPLVRPLRQAVVHGEDGLLGLNTFGRVTPDGEAVQKILNLVRDNPGEVTIVALGPLTNIARAIQEAPESMRQVKEVIIMGGAVDVGGNMKNDAEFNFYVDPEAARIVCHFPVRKVLIPLDVCNQAVMKEVDMNRLPDNQYGRFARTLLAPYAENIYSDTGTRGAIMYDPLALYYAINPDAFVTRRKLISIGVDDDNRGVIMPGLTEIEVATDLRNNFDFADAFIKLMND